MVKPKIPTAEIHAVYDKILAEDKKQFLDTSVLQPQSSTSAAVKNTSQQAVGNQQSSQKSDIAISRPIKNEQSLDSRLRYELQEAFNAIRAVKNPNKVKNDPRITNAIESVYNSGLDEGGFDRGTQRHESYPKTARSILTELHANPIHTKQVEEFVKHLSEKTGKVAHYITKSLTENNKHHGRQELQKLSIYVSEQKDQQQQLKSFTTKIKEIAKKVGDKVAKVGNKVVKAGHKTGQKLNNAFRKSTDMKKSNDQNIR